MGMTVYEGDEAFNKLFNFDFDGMAEEALNEAAPILEAKMKEVAKAGIIHEGESDMVNSIKASKVKKSKNGAWIVNVGPRGYSNQKVYKQYSKDKKHVRTFPVSNALKAIWKEYGIPNKQPAQPFISTACSQVRDTINSIIQKTFEKKVDNES